MERYSSNLTLFYVIFLPAFSWTLLVLGTLGAFLGPLLDQEVYFSFSTKMTFVILLVILSLINIFFALRLRRVEADDERMYISNYFKHSTMPLENIKDIRIRDLWVMRIATINFNSKGMWGASIRVLERENKLEKFCEAHGIPVNV